MLTYRKETHLPNNCCIWLDKTGWKHNLKSSLFAILNRECTFSQKLETAFLWLRCWESFQFYPAAGQGWWHAGWNLTLYTIRRNPQQYRRWRCLRRHTNRNHWKLCSLLLLRYGTELEGDRATYITFFQQSCPDTKNPDPFFLCTASLLQCTVKTDIKQGANKPNYGWLVGKRSGEEEAGSLALVWTLWFHYTYASRSEVAEGMPLALSFLWESLWCIAHKAMFNCGSFFLHTINCVTVYSWVSLHTQGCFYPNLKNSSFHFLIYINGHFHKFFYILLGYKI